ncbi:MAG: glucose-6-phosphate isomerase [Pseudomonadota bacterium]|nr:glucose-6-phosphate isomerase [Pseudomonadota bacterium]
MVSTVKEKLKSSADSIPADGLSMSRLLVDSDREARLRLTIEDMAIDLTRQNVTDDHLHLLLQYADEMQVMEKCHAMLDGDIVNPAEQRSALHAHLRDPSQPMAQSSVDAMAGHIDRLMEMGITDIVSIGIGGSDLGPAMAVAALSPYHQGPDIHFVSNLDPSQMGDCLAGLDPSTTAVLVISKSFSTMETMANMDMAKRWLADHEQNPSGRMLAITSMPDKAVDAGFEKDMILILDEAIGGRYSIWSVVSFGLMLAIGPTGFRAMLAGGHAVDQHILSVSNHQNAPLNIALMRFWNTSILGYQAESLCPYDQRLARFPAWVQQLEMESNGKSVDSAGDPVNGYTAPIIFGEPGSNAQHSFFQHLHQSPIITPITFMAPLRPLMADASMAADLVADHHDALVIQMLAQADALALGSKDGPFPGGRPSTLITWLQVSPYTMGRLFALFEYVTTMSGSLWGLNSFDQPGVELGKIRAKAYQNIYCGHDETGDIETSSRHIFKQLRDLRSGPQIKS